MIVQIEQFNLYSFCSLMSLSIFLHSNLCFYICRMSHSIPQSSNIPIDDEGEQISLDVPETLDIGDEGDEGDEGEQDSLVGTKRRRTSPMWQHFHEKMIGGKVKAICNYCGARLLGEACMGTSHLRKHYNRCKKKPNQNKSPSFVKEKKGGETMMAGSYAFDQETARHALAKMIVAHEYPLAVVDHMFFKEFCSTLQPGFKGVSRNTIKKVVMQQFSDERENTKKLLSKNRSRIAITTDMWTSGNQNKGYMVVTAHFIDDSWNLQSRLVR